MVSRTKVSADDMASPMERRYQHLRRPLVLAVLAVSVIALGIGLGLGLGLKRMPALPATEGQPPASIWQPQVGGSWQIVLESAIRFDDYQKPSVIPDVEIFDIDLYDNEDSCFDALHKLGKKAICYFNAGAYESWRPDSDQFLREDLGKELDGWPGELWLDLRSESVRKIMAERIRLASMKACDAVDPDNVDGYVGSVHLLAWPKLTRA